MITVQAYSPKGVAVKGITEDQAAGIVKQLGPSVCFQYNAKLAAYTFSRKREKLIREIVAVMQCKAPAQPNPIPEPDCHPAGDEIPGYWGKLADLAPVTAGA